MPKKRVGQWVAVLVTGFILLPGLLTEPLRAQSPDIRVGGRVQTQLNTTSIEGRAPSELLIRRARIEIAVEIDDRISGAIQPEFGGGSVTLKDAYLQVELTPGLSVRTGQAHRPFGRLEQTSSKRMPLVERGVRIRGLAAADQYAFVNGLDYSDRDIGVQLLGEFQGGRFGWAAGAFRGPLHGQVGAQNSYQFAGRVTAALSSSLEVGAGWSARDFARPGDSATPELERGHALELDLEYGSFAPGLHVLAEVARGDVDPFNDATFTGGQVWAAWRTEELGDSGVQLEPVLRVSHSSTNRGGDVPSPTSTGTLFTPGLNVYVTTQTRVMVNGDLWRGAGESPDAHSLKVMVQLAF